jgi:predicted metal-binding membrane protein
MGSSPESSSSLLPHRDRIAILSALLGVSVLAWAYVIYLWARMPAMDAGPPATMLALHPWLTVDFVFMFVMWAIMMVGMMLPSAVPMTLLYAGMVRKAERQGTPMAPIAVFVSGYVAMWCLFSVGATLAQWGLHEAAMLSPMMVAKSQVFGGGLLIVAGVYQLTPWKAVCVDHCRSPAHFIAEHWRPGARGAFRLGLHHGAFCLGCCWALMGLLFVGGVMNLLWIAAITVFVFLEKVLLDGPWAYRFTRLAGIGLCVCGIGLLVGHLGVN